MKHEVLAGHIAAFCTILVWGVTFISTKILLRDFSPLEILFLRFALGWLALWLLYPHWLQVKDKKCELMFAAAGLSGVTLYFLLENIALTYTFASNVGVTVSTAPFFTALLAWHFIKSEKPGLNFFAGFALSMGGIILISCNGREFALNPLGDMLALMAAMAWAAYSIFTRKLALRGYASLPATRRIFFYGLLFMLPLCLLTPFSFSLAQLIKPQNCLNLLFLGLGASALCFASWTFSIKKLGAVRTSVYIYLVPVVTIITAYIVLREPFTLLSSIGAALTICGLVLAEMPFTGFRKKAA